MADELAGPLAYSAGWWWVLGVLTLLPVSWAIVRRVPRWVAAWTHRPGSRARLRIQSLAAIAGIERRHSDGDLSERDAHSELSRAVREFVSRRTLRPAESMTLAELELELERLGSNAGRGARRGGSGNGDQLLAAMRVFYDGAFDPRPTSVLTDSARLARTVVTGWN